MIDISAIREQFPILEVKAHGKPLIYLDNAATTQKPLCVLDAARNYYTEINANIHRGVHYLSQLATDKHEQARDTVARFLNASRSEEIIFTSGCTMGINLVAQILTSSGLIASDDEVIIGASEHHSNIVPWQMLCEITGAALKVIPLDQNLCLDLDAYASILSQKTKIVALGHVSNTLGTIHPIKQMIKMAKDVNPDCFTSIDGAQAVSHLTVDVQDLGCDFYAFSGHKLYAPTGIGALWGRFDLLSSLPPFFGGGEMIKEVTFEKTTYNVPPFKYEAGTPNIEGAVSLAAAIDWVSGIGLTNIAKHEHHLTQLAAEGLRTYPELELLIPAGPHNAVISMLAKGIHHYDLGTLLDQMGIAVRTGHHCCQPLMSLLNTTGTTRASFAVYNTEEEVSEFLKAMKRALTMLS